MIARPPKQREHLAQLPQTLAIATAARARKRASTLRTPCDFRKTPEIAAAYAAEIRNIASALCGFRETLFNLPYMMGGT